MTAATTDYALDRLDRAWWPCTRDAVADFNALIPLGSEHLHGRVTIVVIPPDIDRATGHNLLPRLSAAPRWPDTAGAVIAESWRDDGGQAT